MRGSGKAVPFHVVGPVATARDARRLLLISYHFPPSAHVGGLRWQKFTGYLGEAGWQVDVLTRDPAELSQRDPDRLEDLPAGTRLYPVPMETLLRERVEDVVRRAVRRLSPGGSGGTLGDDPSRAGGERNSAFREPDSIRVEELPQWPRTPRDILRGYAAAAHYAKFGKWARRAEDLGAELHRARPYDLVLTSGPPHQIHLAGSRLSRKQGIPFVMDFRDPWRDVGRLPEYRASVLWLHKARKLEARCVHRAALVLANTPKLKEVLQANYPTHREKIVTVMNGVDDDAPAPRREPSCFRVVYAGSIYLDRDPRPLLVAVKRVVDDLGLTPAGLRVEFIGSVSHYEGVPLAQLAESAGVANFVVLRGRLPRAELLEELVGAAMLVSLPQDLDLAIPGKVFEYLQFPCWLLAFAEVGSATELILRRTGADVVSPGDVDRTAAVIEKRYREFCSSGRPRRLDGVDSLLRRRQAERMLRLLEERVLAGRDDGS